MIVRNEDGEELYNAGTMEAAEAFLWRYTERAREAIGSELNMREWVDTLIDNGFYSIDEAE